MRKISMIIFALAVMAGISLVFIFSPRNPGAMNLSIPSKSYQAYHIEESGALADSKSSYCSGLYSDYCKKITYNGDGVYVSDITIRSSSPTHFLICEDAGCEVIVKEFDINGKEGLANYSINEWFYSGYVMYFGKSSYGYQYYDGESLESNNGWIADGIYSDWRPIRDIYYEEKT